MKIKYIVLVGLFSFFMNAQTEKGKFIISGNAGLSFTSSKTSADKTNAEDAKSFSISPSVGYFVIDNLFVGAFSSYIFSSQSSNNNSVSSNYVYDRSDLLIGLQAGYFFKTKGIARPFIAASYGYASVKTSSESVNFEPTLGSGNSTFTDAFSGSYFSLSTGAALFINKNVSFNIGLEYSGVSFNQDKYVPQNFGNTVIGLIFGFSIYL